VQLSASQEGLSSIELVMEKQTGFKYTYEYNDKINGVTWAVSLEETFFAFTIFLHCIIQMKQDGLHRHLYITARSLNFSVHLILPAMLWPWG
jgi:hypothetical protein